MRRSLSIAAVLLALCVGVAACGDDRGGSAEPATTSISTQSAGEPASEDDGGSAADASGKGAESSGRDSGAADSGDSRSSSRKIYGDGSIERFGGDASGEDGSAVIGVASAFYGARGAGDWEQVCDLLSSDIRKQLEQGLGQGSKEKSKDCSVVAATLIGGLPQAIRRQEADTVKFVDVRIEDDSAYAIFESGPIPHGFVPMHREDGEWKVAAISGASL